MQPTSVTEAVAASPVGHRAVDAAARERRMLLIMVLVALALRLAVLTFGATYKFSEREDHFSFGWETGRIARSIAEGEGFSSPFHGDTGPTAWIAPLYPYFLAALFKIFGIYSHGAAWVALAVNSIFSALTCITIFFIGKEVFSTKVGKWTAWTWAVLPFIIYWAVRFAWETSFATFLLSAAFLLALRLEQRSLTRHWIWFGVVWALIALSNPSLLVFLPFCGLWVAYRQRKNNAFRLAPVLLSSAIFLAAIAPWLVRNYRTFGEFVFIRGNFGIELRLGNGPTADGAWMFWLHPTHNKLQLTRYQALGEVKYSKERLREAGAWIRENPGRFAQLSLKRAYFFWFGAPRPARSILESQAKNILFSLSSILALLGLGLAFKKRVRGARLFLWLILLVPMIYYFTFSHPRYRHPIEPQLLLLIVYVISEAKSRKQPGTSAGMSIKAGTP